MIVKTYSAGKEIDRDFLHKIDELQLCFRLKQWKEATFAGKPKICADKARLAMESWQETEGEDIEIRRAKLFKHVLENVPIAIHDFDLVVGRETEHILGANPYIDVSASYFHNLMESKDLLINGLVVKGILSQADRDTLRECVQYFTGKTAPEHAEQAWNSALGAWYKDLEEARGMDPPLKNIVIPGQTTRANWEEILGKGLRGIIQQAETSIQRFLDTQDTNIEKMYFWQAVIITCEAVITYARRYAELARRLAEKEQNADRRSELEEIARICEWVPENPPRTLREAVQSIIFVALGRRLEHPDTNESLGKIDTLLWPYFKEDIHEGRLTLEMAAELIGRLITSLSCNLIVREGVVAELGQNNGVEANINVGGVNTDGNDTANELSYLILHMVGLLKLTEPHCTFLWHTNTPRWLLIKAFETNMKVKGGIPQFCNNIHIIQNLVERGFSLEEARCSGVTGCVSPTVPNKIETLAFSGMGCFNQALFLDIALHNGVAPKTGKRIGLETGDPRTFKTFEELLEAFKKQHEFIVKRILWLGSLAQREESRYVRMPFTSSIMPKCIEKGKDVFCIDSDYVLTICDRAIVDVADSLIAVKKLVFDEKSISMNELLEALDSNFIGERGEEIRQMCLNAPKFGNDIDEVDTLVRDIGSFSGSVIRSYKSPYGEYRIVRPGLSWHYMAGQGVGALANGRKSGEPLNDGSISPMRGMDKFGPTAVLNSVIKASFKESDLTVLNQKFTWTIMRDPKNREKLAMLTDTFFKNGGQHIQYNIVDTQELRDAKEHPENHRDLIVRIGGFSAYFVTLTPEMQDELINRTEHGL
jgi:pyruvate formate-lyase/glycerol dehydratase family glycyl radical enzyme